MNRMQLLLQELDLLNLPKNSYVIVGSGPLAIRGIREPQDLDIMVNDELWEKLVSQYGITSKENGVKVITISQNIEALGSMTFSNTSPELPTVNEQINEAEIIEGHRFQSISHFKLFKKKMGREKDLNDIKLLGEWENSQN
jgi:hypothetical protein